MHALLIAPFTDYDFMRQALWGTLLLALGTAPVGVFLMLRRMSLAGDALAHAVLPGAAAAYLMFGLALVPMTVGGLIAGLTVALASGAVSRLAAQNEDAPMAAFYLISLAAGVLTVSLRGSSVDLMHVLFGTVLALDDTAVLLIGAITAVTLVALAIFWRGLVAECLDPLYLRSVSRIGPLVHLVFLVLVVLNLVSGFQALGTLLSVGLMMLPALAARFWTNRVLVMCVVAAAIGMASGVAGLLLSYHLSLPSGPSIVLFAGGAYLVSLIGGSRGLIQSRRRPHRHRVA